MELDFLQAPRLQALQEQADKVQEETEKRKFLVMLAREIVSAIKEKTVATIEGGVDVNNLDSVTASLRNELARANKPITDILKKLNLTTEEQTSVLQQIEKKAADDIGDEYQTVVVKRIKDKVEVTNLTDIIIPNEYKVTNLSDLASYFKDISDKISALELSVNLPAPLVTVQPTPVNIPETYIPPVDLSPLVKELERNLKPLRTNNKSNPLAVRLTDGGDWVKEIKKLNENNSKQIQYMSDLMFLRDATGIKINPARDESVSAPVTIGDGSQTVTTAGTRVALGTGACRYVVITALATNTDTIWVGGLTVAAGRGRPLVALQAEKIDINDLSKVYLDSAVSGEGVSFVYVN